MLSSSKEKFTQHELRKDTKNFHMMTWQKSVNSETFHVRAGMYLDAREDKHEVNAVRKIKRTLSRRGSHIINKSANLILAPIYKSGILVAVQVKTGAITSSFFFILAKMYARCNASVPDPTATHWLVFANFFLNIFSNLSTNGP